MATPNDILNKHKGCQKCYFERIKQTAQDKRNKEISENKKICSECDKIKTLEHFYKRGNKCKECIAIYNKDLNTLNSKKNKKRKKKYYENNKEEICNKAHIYYLNNKEIISEKKHLYNIIHKEEKSDYNRQYRYNNYEKILNNNKLYKREKRKDATVRLRNNIARQINTALKSNFSFKGGQSIFKYLPYTLVELKQHIESLFSHPDNLTPDGKVWMTWDNYGVYNTKTWDDNDPSTWVWQLDHIIPQSFFKFATMDCQEFRDCWALSNLRPLSGKQNNIDNNHRPNIRNLI